MIRMKLRNPCDGAIGKLHCSCVKSTDSFNELTQILNQAQYEEDGKGDIKKEE